MADISSLIKALKDTAVAQYGKGAPYREALASALKGDMSDVNQALSKSDLTPMQVATTFAPLGITTWHGSPNIFESFNPSQISKANGAAYGHGINVAEAVPTAEFYKNMQPHNNVDLFDIGNKLKSELSKTELHPDTIERIAAKPHWFMETPELVNKYTSAPEALAAIQNVKNKHYNPSNSLYKVDLPDEYLPSMLDWHLPLSKQSAQVQNAIPQDIINNAIKNGASKDPTGQEIYLSLGNDLASAKKLNELGVLGTRFKDTMSSTPEQRYNNYTVFDPNNLKILERK